MSRKTDWQALMRTGLGRLRMAPETFWAMSPREFAAAVEGATGRQAAPMGRGRLLELMAAHPDKPKGPRT
jgi:uncharacterized phage protein (TIGR02216 family)